MSPNAKPTQLTVVALVEDPTEKATPDEFEAQGAIGDWWRRRRAKAVSVDISKAKGQLEDVQRQVESLLAGMSQTAPGGFSLHDVEISLGITAEGSIGVVSAGVEVAIALTYSKA